MDSHVHKLQDPDHLATNKHRYDRPEGRRRYPTDPCRGAPRLGHLPPTIYYASEPVAHATPYIVSSRLRPRDATATSYGSDPIKGIPLTVAPDFKNSRYRQGSFPNGDEIPPRPSVSRHATSLQDYQPRPKIRHSHKLKVSGTSCSDSFDEAEEPLQDYGSRRTRFDARHTTRLDPQITREEKPLPRIYQPPASHEVNSMPHHPRHGAHLHIGEIDQHRSTLPPPRPHVSPTATRTKKRVRIESPAPKDKHCSLMNALPVFASKGKGKEPVISDEEGNAVIEAEKVGPGLTADEIEEEITCPICMAILVGATAAVPCGHVFCAACGLGWIREHENCPICREELAEPITSSLVHMRLLDSLVGKWVTAKGDQWDGLAEWIERREGWQAQRVVWKEDLEAIAQAKKSSLLENTQGGPPAGNDGSFLEDARFEFPALTWDTPYGDGIAQSPFSVFQPDPISAFLDRVRMLEQHEVPQALHRTAINFEGLNWRGLNEQGSLTPSFDPFTTSQPMNPPRPARPLRMSSVRTTQLPPETTSDRLMREMTALLDSLLH